MVDVLVYGLSKCRSEIGRAEKCLLLRSQSKSYATSKNGSASATDDDAFASAVNNSLTFMMVNVNLLSSTETSEHKK